MFENEVITPEVEDEVLLPEGYADGDDIFADSNDWTGEVQVDAPATEPEQPEETTEGGEEEAPTTEPAEPGDSGNDEEAPTTEQTEPVTSKLKFKARVDRADVDVELDESELPTVYQKAQATDRYQAKLAKQAPIIETAERVSKLLGFESAEAMLADAEKNYRDTEVQRLTDSGTAKEIAEDYVSRRIGDATKAKEEAEEPAPAPVKTRDYNAEALELVKARPDLGGKPIPEEVRKACVEDNKTLLVAYIEYEAKQQKAEMEKLRRENQIMKQNEASANRAPVKGVRGGGATDTTPEDDFMRGFNSHY